MTADTRSRTRHPVFPEELLPSSAAPASQPLTELIDRVMRDLAAHRRLADRGDALTHGAALAAAHGALALATRPLCSSADRDLRRAALDRAVPVLVRSDLDHIAVLIAAALALELHPVAVTRRWGNPQ